MTTHAPALFTAEKLTFGFPGKQVLDAVDFRLHAGTITCLLGGNGAGKTTLFNLITGQCWRRFRERCTRITFRT